MKISFASQRPAGAYALAVPVASEDMIADRLAGLDSGSRALAARAAEAQRFEREAGSVVEAFVAEGDSARRLLLVGLGDRRQDDSLFEKVGGALVAKLLTSGETRLVIDLTGLGLDGAAAARIGLGAAARSWRGDP